MKRILFTSLWAYELSWRLRPTFLKRPEQRSDILFAGPWVGEFGWELMNWQGYLRKLSESYKRVIIACREPSAPLYEDFCDELIFHNMKGIPNCHLAHGLDHAQLEELQGEIPKGADHLKPLRYVPAGEQSFIRYGQVVEKLRTDVLIHARAKSQVEYRNWDQARWQELIGNLTAKGMRVGAIGLPGETFDLDGVQDYRGGVLARTMDVMASSRLVVGPSSGPLHLASLCGTPHLVWTDRRTYAMKKTSREKYEHWWNPLQTKVTVLDEDGFDVKVGRVMQELNALLSAD